jgi:Tol biopolymer transport system component
MRKALLLVLLALAWQSAIGQEEYFGQNKVQYKKFDWYYFQTKNFDVYFYKGEDTLAVFAANSLEKAYSEIKEQLNYTLSNRVPIIIYASHNEFQQTNVISELIPEGVGGFTEVFKNRIVIPFTGSYADFRHVLHHELTHAIWFDLLYGNALKSLLSPEALFRPPLWFSEGYAEYSSRFGWDLEADMYMRDAVVQGYLPPLDDLDGFLAYKGGQSACEYIAEKYGEEKIPEILNKGKVSLGMEKAVKAAMGVSLKDLSEGWQKALKRVYWPEIAERQEPSEFAKALTDHVKDGSVFNQKPQWSPKGDRLAFFSDRANPQDALSDRFNEIYIISTVDGKVISRLVKAERSGDLESLHSYLSGLAWSPDGNQIAFIGKSDGWDVLFIYDANTGHRKKKINLHLEGMRNPAWSPDGKKIAFDGTNSGFTDIYVYDLDARQLTRLTADKYEDTGPSWSKDDRLLAFASDRPVDGQDSTLAPNTDYNIFLYDLEQKTVTPVIISPYRDFEPAFSPDGKRIAFVSNRNGIDNIYLCELDTQNVFPVTNIISGAFSPTWSPAGDQIAFSSFYKYGFDIDILKDIKNVGDENGELKPTPYMQKLRSGDRTIFVSPLAVGPDTSRAKPETTGTSSPLDFSTYVFRAGESKITQAAEVPAIDSSQRAAVDKARAEKDTLQYLLPNGEYKRNRYRLKFSPELITGGLSYDNFYGLQGQSYLSISDIFGDHHILIFTDLVNSIDQSNIQLAYMYSAHRWDYAASIFHFKNLYFNDYLNYFFSDRIYGAQAYASYPFSKFSRLDISLNQVTVSRQNYSDIPDKTTNILSAGVEYVNDAVIWGLTGPVSGQRYKVRAEQSVKAASSGLSYRSMEFDFRKYWYFWGRYNFALRAGGGASGGPDPKTYYLGGTSNWIGPKRSKGDIYSPEDIYINQLVVPLRGYSYFADSGTRYGIFNMEFRYPFIDYFKLHFPLPITLGQVSGAIFWDMGAAWNLGDDSRILKDLHFYNPRNVKEDIPPESGDILAGFGFGPRVNLGIFVLRVDLAWGTDLQKVAIKPQWYFSFGAEF